MSPEKLVKMANEIAAFFEAEPDPAARLDGIAGHLKRFWDPRMRQALLRHLEEHPANPELKPVVVETLKTHRELLLPSSRP